MRSGEYQQRIRFALAQLRAENSHHAFERLCRHLARATITRNILPATGPVGAGGDQGRDFETYTSLVSDRIGDTGHRLGVTETDAIAFVCTLQQGKLRSKILSDVARAAVGESTPSLVVVYCEADIPVARRHSIEQAAVNEAGIPTVIFDGHAIAEELADRVDELGWIVSEILQVRTSVGAVAIPRELPAAPLRFVNRDLELSALDRALHAAKRAAGPSVAVLSGMHGVGKSAFGRHWANLNRGHFEGGDLFGDFSQRRHGISIDIADVLAGFLRDLGIADAAIPPTFPERQKLFRRLTADRKLLILLDDVDQSAQVLAMLPSGRGSLVVVTTNYRLDELLFEGAQLIPMEPLDAATSRLLLEEMAGPQRIRAESDAVDLLVETCGGLPIALCVCGGRLVSDRARSPSWLVGEIVGTGKRLKALSGPGEYAIEAIFDFAYSDLSQPAALMYRRLALHPGPDICLPAAAALANSTLETARAALEELHAAHLLEMVEASRYRLHQLVRLHAHDQAEHDEGEEARGEALRRLVDWYYVAARNADWAVVRDRLRLTTRADCTAPHAPEYTQATDAFAWFQSERANVMAIIRVAFEREWDQRVWQFAEALWPLCASHKHFSEWIESHRLAVESARRIRDATVEARVRSQLARAYAETGDHGLAAEEMRKAHLAVAASDNEMLKASVAEFGGVCDVRQGAFEHALAAFREARQRFEACGASRGVALQDFHIGWAQARLGRHAEALTSLDEARGSLARCGDQISVGRVLVRRGEVLRALGRLDDARTSLKAAVELMAGLNIGFEQAEALEILARLAGDRGEALVARRHLQHACRIYKELGHPRADELLGELSRASPE